MSGERGERSALTNEERKIIFAYADNGMRASKAAESVYYSRTHFERLLTAIRIKTGIDPRCFWGLCELIKEAHNERGVGNAS
jgi:hypothetical protein